MQTDVKLADIWMEFGRWCKVNSIFDVLVMWAEQTHVVILSWLFWALWLAVCCWTWAEDVFPDARVQRGRSGMCAHFLLSNYLKLVLNLASPLTERPTCHAGNSLNLQQEVWVFLLRHVTHCLQSVLRSDRRLKGTWAEVLGTMPSLLFAAFVPFFLTLLLLSLFVLIPRSGGKSGSNKKADGVKVTSSSSLFFSVMMSDIRWVSQSWTPTCMDQCRVHSVIRW